MRDFPPKLIDMVIDHLPEDPESPEEPGLDLPMSNYSTVSRQWVERTQKHHFHRLFFPGPPYVQRWHEVFNPNPSGVSRHVRHLTLMRIDSLEDEDFDDHIRAFIHVQQLNLYGCSLLSLCDVRSLAIMGSSLVGLEIRNTKTTSHFMATLLVGLPHLRYLNIYDLMVEKDSDPAGPPPRIPFFEGANSFILSMVDCSPRNLDWIPPSPRFRDLRIEASTIQYYPALVNRWLDSSSRTLERFIVMEDLTDAAFDCLHLSSCTSLTYLGLPVTLDQPGQYADAVLPSLPFSPLSKVVLQVLASDDEEERIDPTRWEKLDMDLCWLAKRSKKAHGGRKMEVEVYVPEWWPRPWDSNQSKNEWPMPNLEKEANILILEHYDFSPLDTVDWYELPWVTSL